MQNPKETIDVIFKGVPIDKAPLIKRIVYRIKYKADPKDSIVYYLIEQNPTTPLKELQKELRNKYKLQKTINKIRQMAIDCQLPYTE